MRALAARRRLLMWSFTALALAASGLVATGVAQASPRAETGTAAKPATKPAARATARAVAGAAAPTVIHTVASNTIGGLPYRTLDGRTVYLPGPATGRAVAAHAPVGAPPPPIAALPPRSTFAVGSTGYDLSWPNCGATLPAASSVAVVGVDDGTPITENPCLAKETAWSPSGVHADYMVLNSPVGWNLAVVLQYAYHGPKGNCTSTDYACQSYNWGYNAAAGALQYAKSQNADTHDWWLDVELPSATSIDAPGSTCYQPNVWICDTADNSLVITGAVAELASQGKIVGDYSTRSQWTKITGTLADGRPIWIAGWSAPAATYCAISNKATYWFDNGTPWLIQSQPTTTDPDTAC